MQHFPSKGNKCSGGGNSNLGTIQNMSPEDKETEINEAEVLEREEELNTAENKEQNVMTSYIIKITSMRIAQVKELETASDDRKNADITNDNIDGVTMKYYTMTTAKDESRIFTKGSLTIKIKTDIRLEVEEVCSIKSELRAIIIIDQDDNGAILDTVKYTRTANDNPLDILNNKYSRTPRPQDQHRALLLNTIDSWKPFFWITEAKNIYPYRATIKRR